MTEKVIIDIYYTYGKGDGAELSDRIVVDNTIEGRDEVFDCFSYDYAHDSGEDFVNGKIDVFSFDKYGGDWDEPTGGYIVANTKEDLVDQIQRMAMEKISRIEALLANR